jgi:hypothetical protein
MKKIKANQENLFKALQMRFSKYDVKLYDEDEYDVQIGIFDTTTPTLCDVRGIVSAFFKEWNGIVNCNNFFGFIEIYVSDGVMRKNVDVDTLSMYVSENVLESL